MSGRGRFGFRARLTALILVVFLAAGAALVGVQNILARQALEYVVVSWEAIESDVAPQNLLPTEGDEVHILNSDVVPTDVGPGNLGGFEVSNTATQALDTLGKWSLVVLGVFAVVAAALANWLAGRSTRRMAQIARAAQGIDASNRHERLAMDGPRDEVRELGDTIDSMLDRLDAAMTRQESFVSAASHELRTPLATARASLEIPLVQGRFDDDVRPDVERALAATERSEDLIATLLTLARSQGGDDTVPTPTAADALGATRAALAEAPDHPDVELRTDVAGDGGTDSPLLQIAVSNLVRNALVHNEAGGWAHVTVGEADPWEIRVENTGPVVSPAELARIREPFNRGDRTRLAGGGTGLGLSIVDAIAGRLGLDLELEARDGGGLIATLRAPGESPAPATSSRDPRP